MVWYFSTFSIQDIVPQIYKQSMICILLVCNWQVRMHIICHMVHNIHSSVDYLLANITVKSKMSQNTKFNIQYHATFRDFVDVYLSDSVIRLWLHRLTNFIIFFRVLENFSHNLSPVVWTFIASIESVSVMTSNLLFTLWINVNNWAVSLSRPTVIQRYKEVNTRLNCYIRLCLQIIIHFFHGAYSSSSGQNIFSNGALFSAQTASTTSIIRCLTYWLSENGLLSPVIYG